MMTIAIAPMDIVTTKPSKLFSEVYVPKAHFMGWTELNIVPYNKARVIPRALVRHSKQYGWLVENEKSENVFVW